MKFATTVDHADNGCCTTYRRQPFKHGFFTGQIISSDLFSTTKYHVAPDKSALKQLERAVGVFQESLQSSTGHGGLYSDL